MPETSRRVGDLLAVGVVDRERLAGRALPRRQPTPPGTVPLRLISQLPLAFSVPPSGVPVKPCAGSRMRKSGTSRLNWLVFSIVTSYETVPVLRSDRCVVKVSLTYCDRSLTAVNCVT